MTYDDLIAKAGITPSDPTPWYRVWGSRRGSIVIRLYKEN